MNAPSKPNLYYIFVTITYLLFVLSSSSLFAQSPAAVKKIEKQFDLANDYAHSGNPGKAIPILYKIKEDCEKINYKQGITRVGHTLAIIYFNSTDYKKVITLDDEFLRIGEEIKDYEKLCQIHRLKGCAYSELGLLNKDNEERLESLKYAKKIQNRNSRQQAISLIYGNLANHYIKSGAPKDSVFVNISKSITEAKKIDDADASFRSKKYSLIAYSYLTLGDQFSKAGQPETAENYFLKALEIHNSQPVPFIEQVTLLSELGYFYYVQKKYEKAVKYAELGVNYEKKASFPQIRRDLFETLSKSYLELHKTDDSKRYLGLFTALNDSISNVDKSAVNLALSHSISNQKKMFVDYTGKRTALYVLSSLTFIVFGGWFFLAYKKKKHKQIKKMQKILERLESKKSNISDVLEVVDNKAKVEEKEEEILLMSAEAEEKLLEKLQTFESKRLYLERKVSLPYVATAIESNTKYLSYIIKKHKGKDFNKYINDLRINYIVQKINDEPKYRQYKINFLAEETGFSSHSKFATIFKSTIGVSPSEFIKYLDDSQKLQSV